MADPGVLNTLPLEGSNPSTPTNYLSFSDYAMVIYVRMPGAVYQIERLLWPEDVDETWDVLGNFVGQAW